jgi:iron complex transport system substrate-binding protein
VSDEQIFARDPDVILTNVDWMDDPIANMVSRPGWGGLTAVQGNRIYVIEANASSRPSHNIVIALQQMAMAVYPEYFIF